MRRSRLLSLAALVFSLLLAGCRTVEYRPAPPREVVREIVYVPVAIGATPNDVVLAIGEPTSRISDGVRETWKYPSSAEILFHEGHVIRVTPPAAGVLPSQESHVQPTAENGSYYGEISPTTGRPKTVHVRGYYRNDGTYVRSHYRSAPRRRPWPSRV